MATGQFAPHDSPEQAEWEDRGFTVQDLLLALRRRWWVVPLVFVLVVGFSMWRTLRQQRLYRAAATVRIQENQQLLPGMQQGMGGDWRVDRLLSEQLVIKSQEVANRVVDELGLAIVPIDPEVRRADVFHAPPPPRVSRGANATEWRVRFGPDAYSVVASGQAYGPVPYGDSLFAGGILFRFPGRPPIDRPEVMLGLNARELAAGAIRGGITTSVIPSTDIVQIAYTGTEPEVVRAVTNAIADAYAEFSAEQRKESAQSKSAFIRAQLRDQEQRLRGAQDELKRFKERYQTADVSAEQLSLAGNIANLEQTRQEVIVERNIYERLIGGLEPADTLDEQLRKIVGTGAGEKNQSIANLYAQWFELVKEREQLLARGRTADNADVEAIDRMITRTKRDLQTSSQVYLQALTSRLESLDRSIAAQRTAAQRYPPLEAEQVRLMADVATTQGLYDELQSQYQLAIIAEAAETGQVTLIDSATTPMFAISPNRKRALLTAVIFGLALGLGAAVLLDRLDNSVRSPDEIARRFDVTVLGLIPRIRLTDVNADPSTTTAMNRLVTHADPRSPVAEAYRSLRTNLAFARAHQDLKTLVLTSPGPADGKSTTIANLAITFAQQGQRTLIIDADLRRAVLDKTFGVPRSPGLTDVLVGTTPLEQAVHATDIPNLFVLGSGQFPPNPSELLGSEAMQAMIEETKRQFDVALFDTPPLLAVTDAAVLSTRVDGTMLVVRMGSTAREAVRRAILSLRAVHGRILGVVLNDVDFRAGSYYGGYGYYYSYYYYGESNTNGNGAPTGVMDRLRRLTTVAGRRRG